MLVQNNANPSKMFSGHIDIWKFDPVTGKREKVVSKSNTVLKQGAKIITHSLAGSLDYKIRYFYVGYCNNVSFTPPVIDTDYTVPFSSLPGGFGYLREPITFSPSFSSDATYTDNSVFFTATVSSTSVGSGASFTSGTSKIYEVGLVAAPTGNVTGDLVLARTNFNSLVYDNNENLVITWGLKITV